MKIEEIEGKIVLEPESDSEQELINAITQANENLIFQLQKEQGTVSFVNLGSKETVFNEAINILYSSELDAVSVISKLGI